MATTKRMFSNDIVGSDAFLEMPSTSQTLYFHLGMRCDDDGFVNPNVTMRMIGSNKNDLDVLITKRFLLLFKNGVVVIKHHRINNRWDSRDCRRTLYTEELKQLFIKENRSYTFDENQGVPVEEEVITSHSAGIPSGLRRQNRIEENRIEENRIDSTGKYSEDFEKFYQTFPSRRKAGKKAPWLKWLKLSEEEKKLVLEDIPNRSKNHGDWLKQNGDFIPAPEVYLNKQQWLMPIVPATVQLLKTVDRFTN